VEVDRVPAPLNAGAPAVPGGDRDSATIVNGTTFCLSSADGDIATGEPHGLFFRDARLLSQWTLLLDGHPAQALSATLNDADRARFVLRRRPPPGRADSTLLVVRDRSVDNGLRETITVDNIGRETTSFELTVRFEADFADLFAVKEGRQGQTEVAPTVSPVDVTVRSVDDPARGVRITATGDPELSPNALTWQVVAPSRERWQAVVSVQPVVGAEWIEAQPSDDDEQSHDWLVRMTAISVEHPGVAAVIRRSGLDLDALRIKNPDGHAFLAAGAPWYMTLFGRDSLLTAWMCLPLDAELALGTLQTLAAMQGREVDPMTEEQPGRILHELRLGPYSQDALGGQEYYGTVDATPLFVMLLAEAWRWGADPPAIRRLLPAADAAITWLSEYGDSDHDGFIEYRRATDQGLLNQGWKDSYDAINFAAGGLADGAIALCEVQGYAYAALLARAELAVAFGDDAAAHACRARASVLKDEFARTFWVGHHGWYAMALDGDKRQVDSLSSNAAHCLWTGIATDAHAARLINAMSTAAMDSGYGLRTLSADMGAYNPMSYHNGSVWPHDNAIAIAGLMRYGHIPGAVELAHRLANGVFDAAGHFGGRLPELYCGFPRNEFSPPIPYPTSCSPQAWASGAPLLILRAFLGIEPDEPSKKLRVRAKLPKTWGEVSLDGLRLGESTASLRAHGDDIVVDGLPPSWRIERA
jgi:glycogen debranching enzyme